jgi:hypothetical protein
VSIDTIPVGKRTITWKPSISDALDSVNRRMSSESSPELTAGKNKLGFWVRYRSGRWEITISRRHSLADALEELGRMMP